MNTKFEVKGISQQPKIMSRQSLLREVRPLEEKLERTMRHVGILERVIAEIQTRYNRAYHSNQQLFMLNLQLKHSSLKDVQGVNSAYGNRV